MARSQDFLIRILGDASKGISELDKFSKKAEDLTAIGRAGMVMGGLLAAGVGLAVARYAEFDAAMSNVVATGEDAARNQDALRAAAISAGASTVFSATEAANAVEELAKAGVSAEDTLGGALPAALDLAAAGGLGVADAASIMATSMNQFSVKGRDATHVADLLAAGAGKAQGDVSDMAGALNQAGLVADATGLSIEETTGGLAAFASAGLLGSDAGTSFKSMLQRLTPQSAEAQRRMDELGISAYDAGGNFIGLASFAGNLQSSLRSLTPEQRQSALATIFGSDAVRAATILYNQGAQGIQTWTEAVDDQGYAAQVAATRLDNLQGDVEALGGAFDSALIQAGSGANDSLRALVQSATEGVSVFGELPEPVQQSAIYLATAASAVGLLGGGALVAVPKIAQLKDAIAGTSLSVRGLSLAAGGLTVGLTAVIAIVAAVASEQAEARARAEAYADTLEQGTQRVTDATRAMTKENLSARKSVLWWEQSSAYENAEKLGIALDDVTAAVDGNVEALKRIDAATSASNMFEEQEIADRLGISLTDLSVARGQLREAIRGESASIDEAIAKKQLQERADRAVTTSTQTSAQAYLQAADNVAGLSEEVDKLIESINTANGVGQDAVTSNARYKESLTGISAEVQSQRDAYEAANGTVEGFSLSLDENTVSGSANAAMLAGVAKDAQSAALAQYEVDKTTVGADQATKNYAGTLAAQRQAFVDAAGGAGYNADEVQRLADKVFALPSEKQLTILADTSQAKSAIERLVTTYSGAQITVPIRGSANFNGPGYAGGGEVRGPGTGTSDSILAWLSNGEFVVQEQAAQKNKGVLQWINAGGTLPGYAEGGSVGTVSLTAVSAPRVPMLSIASSARSSEADAARDASAGDQGGGSGDVYLTLSGSAAPFFEQMDLHFEREIKAHDRERARVVRMGRQRGA